MSASASDMERTGSVDKKDIGHVEAVGGDDYVYVPDTPEERRLVRKIDLHLLPMLWIMYLLNYVSRPKEIWQDHARPCDVAPSKSLDLSYATQPLTTPARPHQRRKRQGRRYAD
jgi:hypothetical protein